MFCDKCGKEITSVDDEWYIQAEKFKTWLLCTKCTERLGGWIDEPYQDNNRD